MKKILCIILIIMFLLCGCSGDTDKNTYTPDAGPSDISVNDDKSAINDKESVSPFELKPFVGEWVTTKLSVTPRVALVASEYAKAHSDIIGKKVLISEECLTFEGENFYVSETEICNGIEMMGYHNITVNGAYTLYHGDKKDMPYTTTDCYIKDITLYTADKETIISLVVRPDNSLMLWVGEQYEYIGFYELAPIKTYGIKNSEIEKSNSEEVSNIDAYIKKYEGGPYSDICEVSDNDWRIGYGYKIQDYFNDKEDIVYINWNKNEAEWVFSKDMQKMKNTSLIPFLLLNRIELTQNQFDAMLSFTFSYGEHTWEENGFPTMKRFLLKGDYSKDATEKAFATYMDASLSDSHIARRKAEMELFLSKTSGNDKVHMEYRKPVYSHSRGLEIGELEPFIGKWVVKKLSVTPRVGLVSEEYAKEHNDIIGKEVLVLKGGINFNSQKFSAGSIEDYKGTELMSSFNITPAGACMVCCGSYNDPNFMISIDSVDLISMYSRNNKTNVYLVLRKEDNTLMLWVGEQYKYIGFYELERIE